MDLPLISIIVPVFNVEKYLSECIQSIISQTYKNLEILLIDDGSTDNSGKMCDHFAKIDDRIIVLHKKNGGLSDARNAGLNVSHGRYISFVDSDDKINPKFIETLYKLIISGDFQISQVGVQFITSNDKKMNKAFSYKTGISILTKQQFMQQLLLEKITWAVWCNLYSKNFFKNVRFTKGQLNEDTLMWVNGIEKIKNIIITSKCLYEYRQRKGSITSGSNLRFHCDELKHALLWKNKVDKYYPQISKEAEYYFYTYLYIYIESTGSKKLIEKWKRLKKIKIKNILLNNYLSSKKKLVYLGIYFFSNKTIKIMHKYFQLKNNFRG